MDVQDSALKSLSFLMIFKQQKVEKEASKDLMPGDKVETASESSENDDVNVNEAS